MEDQLEPIDLVVPFVNAADANWQQLFLEYTPKSRDDAINSIVRFRSPGSFWKYFFRGIEKNLPWIRKVFLLVQSDSQVPTWINQDSERITIVTHDMFIPQQFLPTFTSTTIEMFLWNIPGLSERFLYTNDDTFAINPMDEELFFKDGKLCNGPNTIVYEEHDLWKNHCLNGQALVFEKSKEELKRESIVFSYSHSIRPYFKSVMTECYLKYQKEITNSISCFRTKGSINVYVYDDYNYSKQLFVRPLIRPTMISSRTGNGNIRPLLDSFAHTVCIQDTDQINNIYTHPILNNWFKEHYPNKSCFEK